jgi:hypothetical protein
VLAVVLPQGSHEMLVWEKSLFHGRMKQNASGKAIVTPSPTLGEFLALGIVDLGI